MDWNRSQSLPWDWNTSSLLLDAPEFEMSMFGMVSWELKLFLALMYGSIALLGLLGNAVTITALVCDKALWKLSRTGLLNMAVADIVFLCSMPMVISNTLTRSWIMGLFLCKLFYWCHHVGTYAGVFHLTYLRWNQVLSTNRTPTIKNYLQTRKCQFISSAVLWSGAVLAGVPVLIFAQLLSHPNGTKFVFMLVPKGGVIQSHNTFVFYTFTCGFVFPVALILLSYLIPFFLEISLKTEGETFYTDDTSDAQEQTDTASNTELLSPQENEQVLVTMIVSLCIICILPSWICSLYTVTHDELLTYGQRIIFGLLSIAATTFSAVKPFVYICSDKSFRTSCRYTFGRLTLRHESNSTSPPVDQQVTSSDV